MTTLDDAASLVPADVGAAAGEAKLTQCAVTAVLLSGCDKCRMYREWGGSVFLQGAVGLSMLSATM
jgi:hypothetical protein